MYYELTNSPSDPISVADAKAFLRVDATLDDAVIGYLITAATEWGEGYTGIDFRPKEWLGFFENLCVTNTKSLPFLKLEKTPITADPTVRISVDGVFTAFTDFIYQKSNGFSVLLFTENVVIDDTAPYTFEVTIASGQTTISTGLKTALLEHIAFLYENRGDAPSEPNDQIKQLYNRYRHIAGFA